MILNLPNIIIFNKLFALWVKKITNRPLTITLGVNYIILFYNYVTLFFEIISPL